MTNKEIWSLQQKRATNNEAAFEEKKLNWNRYFRLYLFYQADVQDLNKEDLVGIIQETGERLTEEGLQWRCQEMKMTTKIRTDDEQIKEKSLSINQI